MKTKKIITLTL